MDKGKTALLETFGFNRSKSNSKAPSFIFPTRLNTDSSPIPIENEITMITTKPDIDFLSIMRNANEEDISPNVSLIQIWEKKGSPYPNYDYLPFAVILVVFAIAIFFIWMCYYDNYISKRPGYSRPRNVEDGEEGNVICRNFRSKTSEQSNNMLTYEIDLDEAYRF